MDGNLVKEKLGVFNRVFDVFNGVRQDKGPEPALRLDQKIHQQQPGMRNGDTSNTIPLPRGLSQTRVLQMKEPDPPKIYSDLSTLDLQPSNILP